MSWQEILGHDENVERFRRAVVRGRLASTFLFVGPEGVGKRAFAFKLAQALLCEQHAPDELDPCGSCPACAQVAAQTHPDLEYVNKPEKRSFIPVETFIGDREHRMREGLCFRISMKPSRGGYKVAIIDDADYLNVEGANCLLKTLEEPPPHSLIVLIGTSEQRQLPTIRSRCQTVRFRPLPQGLVAQLLLRNGLIQDDAEAEPLAALSGGSMVQAMRFASSPLGEFRKDFLPKLRFDQETAADMAKWVAPFIDAAGKDAADRRERFKQVVGLTIDFYRHLMHQLSGAALPADPLTQQVSEEIAASCSCDAQRAGLCLERCLYALQQIEANANQATLIEAWLDDLAQTMHGRGAAVGS